MATKLVPLTDLQFRLLMDAETSIKEAQKDANHFETVRKMLILLIAEQNGISPDEATSNITFMVDSRHLKFETTGN